MLVPFAVHGYRGSCKVTVVSVDPDWRAPFIEVCIIGPGIEQAGLVFCLLAPDEVYGFLLGRGIAVANSQGEFISQHSVWFCQGSSGDFWSFPGIWQLGNPDHIFIVFV